MTEVSLGRFNAIAFVGAMIAIGGLVFVVVADRMYDDVTTDYLLGDLLYDEYWDKMETVDSIWTLGIILIAVAVIAVGVAVPVGNASTVNKLKAQLESDFYRRCPSCGEWNTRMVPNCTTCGILLPKLHDMQAREVEPRMFKDRP